MVLIIVQKSYGKMRGTRKKMRAKARKGVTAYMQKFMPGDMVHIDFVPSSPIQHPRFDGKTGTVIEQRGRSYAVSITDGSMNKMIFVRPEHMRVQTRTASKR